ncbi:hypothetical protein PGB90_003247 [Kerria lacca]
MKHLVLFIFLHITRTYSEKTPQIIQITENQIVNLGGTTELSCLVLYAHGYSVVWEKLGQETNDLNILSSDATSLVRDTRLSLVHDPDSATYTLQIRDIQNSDAGVYKCSILISTTSSVSKEVTLEINNAPIIYDNFPSNVVVVENNSIDLECYAKGFPKPQISWRRENSALLPSGGIFYRGNIFPINNIKREDKGVYYCTAHNNIGKDVRGIGVDVEFPPSIRPFKSRIEQPLKFSVILGCRMEAFPSPVIKWSKDRNIITNNKFYKIKQETSFDYKESTLQISSLQPNHFGIYICSAMNKIGFDAAEIVLTETVLPACFYPRTD